LIEASYVVKGEVRGTYYVTVEGRLAYRLAQWLTHRVEMQRERKSNNGDVEDEVDVEFVDDTDLETTEEHLETLADELEKAADEVEAHHDELEEAREEALEEEEDLDELDWND
jgi:hypothetical protein